MTTEEVVTSARQRNTSSSLAAGASLAVQGVDGARRDLSAQAAAARLLGWVSG